MCIRDRSNLLPGSVYPYNKDGLYVVCGDQKVLKINELINPKGKKVKGEDFIRGYKVERFI
jgi:methionyl-tRNA formyltransferase